MKSVNFLEMIENKFKEVHMIIDIYYFQFFIVGYIFCEIWIQIFRLSLHI